MTEDQFVKITRWQQETFGTATATSKLHHLKQEVKELLQAIKTEDPKFHLEFADCFILLFGAAHSIGMEYSDICDCIEEKMQINQLRKWGYPDDHGVVNHLRSIQDIPILSASELPKIVLSTNDAIEHKCPVPGEICISHEYCISKGNCARTM